MFGSKKSAGEVTFVSREAVFRGSLQLKGALFVDGRVEGDIDVEGEVSVGPNGVVVGHVDSDRLTVAGRVEGQVRVRGLLRIQKGGVVRDSVVYGSLEVEKGGALFGHTGAVNDEGPSELANADGSGVARVLPASVHDSADHASVHDVEFDTDAMTVGQA